jgi:hypothetical protein
MRHDNQKFWQNYYGSLEGATIIKFNGFTKDDKGELATSLLSRLSLRTAQYQT